jgi:hypothetical protein
MEMLNSWISLYYGFIAFLLLVFSFWVKPGIKGWPYYILLIGGFVIGGLVVKSYFLAGSALIAVVVNIYRLRQYLERNRTIEVILIPDRDDNYLNYFLRYYKKDIENYFPRFDFKIEEEFLVALLFSNMETVGLVIAEIRDQETLRICVDYMVPKYRNSQLAKTFYQCELRCIDFLGYRQIYIEPQSKEHNEYLERIGFRLIEGKYVINAPAQ